MGFGLPKYARLYLRRDIEELFARGKSVGSKPLKCYFLPVVDAPNSKLMVSVPKKLFKRAVDRNLLKRRMREAFRLNRELLGDGVYSVGLIYTKPHIAAYSEIENSVKILLTQIVQRG